MKIAIIGFGLEGHAAYDYFKADNDLTICDRSTELSVPEDVNTQLGDEYLHNLDQFEVIVRSPNVHPDMIVAANSPAIKTKITSNLNLFLEACPTKQIIGVTGTKGKGTTSTLITMILKAAGKTVHLGGNIGIAPLSLLTDGIQAEDWVVLELSSFQLEDARHSPHIAVCLMVQAEHLDWHKDMNAYLRAKQQLFRFQTPEDIAIYYSENSNSEFIVSLSPAIKIPYLEAPGTTVHEGIISIDGHEVCTTGELKLLGKHNWQNVCAAITTVWQVTQDLDSIRQVITSFSGLPFRIERRPHQGAISYYNDSFASGAGATLAAIAAIPEPKVLILGGYDRGLPLDDFASSLKQLEPAIHATLLIGASAERLAATLTKHGFTNFTRSHATDMPTIVAEATKLARPGDAVVLSPAFASFDMFKNFEDRGLQFNAAVEQL